VYPQTPQQQQQQKHLHDQQRKESSVRPIHLHDAFISNPQTDNSSSSSALLPVVSVSSMS